MDANAICFSCSTHVSCSVPLLFCSHTAWADNADACAKQYAGTGALKTDFTRSVFTHQTAIILLNTCKLPANDRGDRNVNQSNIV